MRKIISTILVLALMLTCFAPLGGAQASNEQGYVFDESIPEGQIQRIINVVEDENFEREVEKGLLLQPYINAEGRFIEFDYKQALKDGLPAQLVTKTKKDFDKANMYLAKEQQKGNITSNGIQLAAKASCGGVNKFEGNLVAGTVYIDSCRTNKMVAIIAGGGGASSLIGLLPGGAAVAIVAVAIFAIGGAIISYNNANGTGIKVRVLKNPFTGKLYPYCINPQ